ncbi:uncharacterized protein LOC118203817 [Stegodyphus dumicola]|uniref:uncharacterized protein LOC118203817 n=1 Tax=Stegodyphus dumicola TaxID=202533 RepID=UPI0015B350E6|nr:uncharacterized protein LOC118203817 [Stegodyphus dumicola]
MYACAVVTFFLDILYVLGKVSYVEKIYLKFSIVAVYINEYSSCVLLVANCGKGGLYQIYECRAYLKSSSNACTVCAYLHSDDVTLFRNISPTAIEYTSTSEKGQISFLVIFFNINLFRSFSKKKLYSCF